MSSLDYMDLDSENTGAKCRTKVVMVQSIFASLGWSWLARPWSALASLYRTCSPQANPWPASVGQPIWKAALTCAWQSWARPDTARAWRVAAAARAGPLRALRWVAHMVPASRLPASWIAASYLRCSITLGGGFVFRYMCGVMS